MAKRSRKKTVTKKVSRKKSPRKKSVDLSNVWPQERDYMTRPERLRYVRKLIHQKGCVFCTAWKKPASFDSLVLYKGQHAMVILNKYPYNTAHLMVIPKYHKSDFLELNDATHAEISMLMRKVIHALKEEYNPAGFNVGLNLGAVAGAGIPQHLHWHIVPRWTGDTNFFPLIAETKVLPESLDQTYDRLRRYF